MYASYGKLSTEYYHHTKPIGYSIMGDIEYYTERLNGVVGKVLEAGVGTGRFIIPLLESGFNIDGVDSSKEMLDICKAECAKLKLNTKLFLGDLEELNIEEGYECIVMPTGSFMLLDDGVKVLKNFYSALKEGGRLIFDVSLPSDFTAGEISTTIIHTSEEEGILLESRNLEHNFVEQYTRTLLKYEKYSKGELIETELQNFVLYYYGLRELELILKELGFKDISISADYVYGAVAKAESEVITIEVRK